MVVLGPAKQVSPLIRFARYACLSAGIVYGYNRHNFLAGREVAIQEYENEVRAKYAAKKAAEKEVTSKVEMEELAKEAGITSS